MRRKAIKWVERYLYSYHWLTIFLMILTTNTAIADQQSSSLNSQQFTILSTQAIDIQLDGLGGNTTNSYETYSPDLHPAPQDLRTIVLEHELKHPTAHTANTQTLARCQFISTGLELDNVRETQEWLITTQNRCPPASHSGLKTFWLVQREGNTKAVLLAERGQKRVFIPKQTTTSGYRPLSLRIMDSRVFIRGNQYKANCKKYWEAHNKRYIGQPEQVEVWAIDPVSNSKKWLAIHHAFPEINTELPVACPRY